MQLISGPGYPVILQELLLGGGVLASCMENIFSSFLMSRNPYSAKIDSENETEVYNPTKTIRTLPN